MKKFKFAWILLFIITLMGVRGYSQQGVGMIIRSQGKTTVVYQQKESTAYPMMPLYVGSKVITGKDGEILLVYYPDGKEYTIKANAQTVVKEKSLVGDKGKIAVNSGTSAIPLPQDTVINSRRSMGIILKGMPNEGTGGVRGTVPESSSAGESLKGGIMGGTSKSKVTDKDEVFHQNETGITSPLPSLKIISPGDKEVLSLTVFAIRWEKGTCPQCKISIEEEGRNAKSPIFSVNMENKGEYLYENKKGADFQIKYGGQYILTIRGMDKDKVNETAVIHFRVLSEKDARILWSAEAEFNRLVKNNPQDSAPYLLMADLYKRMEMYYSAIETIKKIENGNNPYICYYIGELYEKVGDEQSSLVYIEKGRKMEK